jgi:hypothetical protein
LRTTNSTNDGGFLSRTTIVCFALLAFPGAIDLCFGGGLSVLTGDTTASAVKAPQVVSRAAVVVNSFSAEVTLTERVVLPPGWQVLSADTAFTLAIGKSETRLVAFVVPAQASPGCYSVSYTVFGEAPEARGGCDFLIEVLPVFKLEVSTGVAPRRIIAGENFNADFEVTNHGNTECSIRLEAQNSEGDPVNLSDSEIIASPGESRIIRAATQTKPALSRSITQRLTLNANIYGFSQRGGFATNSAAAEILPRSTFIADLYHRIPASAIIRYFGTGGEATTQAECSGGGILDSRRDIRLKYLLRGPGNLENNVFGLRDEYAVELQSRQWTVQGGDGSFNLSPLLEQNRLGRGAQLSIRKQRVKTGGFWMTSRGRYNDLRESGFFAGFAIKPGADFQINALRKKVRYRSG